MAALGDGRVRFGKYELLLELAAGGMGTAYIARHVGARGFERLVAELHKNPYGP